MYCIGMIHLYKRWVYFPNLHLLKSLSLSLSLSFPPSATVYFYPQTFSRPLARCVWKVLLLTNRCCSDAGMRFRSCCFRSCAVILFVWWSPAPHADWQELQPHSLWVTEPVQTRTVEVKEQILLQQSRTVEDELIRKHRWDPIWIELYPHVITFFFLK